MPNTLESEYFKVTLLVCYWDVDEGCDTDARTNYYRLRRTLADRYGYYTHLHKLEHAKSSGANQVALISKVLSLLDGKLGRNPNNGEPPNTCICKPNKSLEAGDLFVFLYMGSSKHAIDYDNTSSCLFQSSVHSSSSSSSSNHGGPNAALSPVVNFSAVRRAVLDVVEADVLMLLGCAYEESDTNFSRGKELIAARREESTGDESAFLGSQFIARIASQLEEAAETKQYLTTSEIFNNLLAASSETHPIFLRAASDRANFQEARGRHAEEIKLRPGNYREYRLASCVDLEALATQQDEDDEHFDYFSSEDSEYFGGQEGEQREDEQWSA